MSKEFLNLLIMICLGLGIVFAAFGKAILVVCGVALLALVAFVLIPCYRNAPMARRTKLEKNLYRSGVERRKRLGLKTVVWSN